MAKERKYTDDQIIFECYGVFRVKYDLDNEDEDVVISYEYIKSFRSCNAAKKFAEEQCTLDGDEVFKWYVKKASARSIYYILRFIGHNDEEKGFIPADEPYDEIVIKHLRLIEPFDYRRDSVNE